MNQTEETKDERLEVLLNTDEWTAVEKIVSVLPKIPGICQRNRVLCIIDDSGLVNPISFGKLRHYIGTVCRFFNDSGRRVHPTNRLVSGVKDHGIYPGVRSVS